MFLNHSTKSIPALTILKQSGFSLVEMAIVLLIVGLLLGGLLAPLATQVNSGRIKSTQQILQSVSDALIGFAVTNGRLPCPDTTGDGLAQIPPCPTGTNAEGNVPWKTLGVGRKDAWGLPLRYRPNVAYTTSPIADPPNTTGGLRVEDLSGTVLTAVDPDAPAAIIFSCGADGIPNGENDANITPNTNATCVNPGTPNNIYVTDAPIENTYDDTLIWLSKYKLLARMVAANKWP